MKALTKVFPILTTRFFVNGYAIVFIDITRKYAEKKRMMRRVLRSILLRFVCYVGDIKKIEKRNVRSNFLFNRLKFYIFVVLMQKVLSSFNMKCH